MLTTNFVQRDTDGEGDPDVTDPDDDNDGFTDEEEIDAGTDPKDSNSYLEDKSDNVDTNDGNNVQPTPRTNIDDSDEGVVDVPVIHPVDVDDHQVKARNLIEQADRCKEEKMTQIELVNKYLKA